MGQVLPRSFDLPSECELKLLAVDVEGGAGGWRGWEEVRNRWGGWKLKPDREAQLQ